MKRVFIALMILAASAVFANTPNDPEVTLNWAYTANSDAPIVVTDLEGDNGFTAVSNDTEWDYWSVVFTAQASGWLFDPNESINVTVIEDFIPAEEFVQATQDDCYIRFAGISADWQRAVMYLTPYNGKGDYTLTLTDNFGFSDGEEPAYAGFSIGYFEEDSTEFGEFTMAYGDTITVKFGSTETETVVPEPATYAYALMGFGSLLGIKRRIKK